MTHALHYPTIEFNDVDAFKRSLLVWDRIHRIVPNGYEPQDQPEVSEAAAAGAVLNLTVDGEREVKSGASIPGFLQAARLTQHASDVACRLLKQVIYAHQPRQD